MDKLKINDYGLTPLTYDEASGINGGQVVVAPIVIATAGAALLGGLIGLGTVGMGIASAGIGLIGSIFKR